MGRKKITLHSVGIIDKQQISKKKC